MLPLLLTAVHEGRLHIQDIVDKLYDNPKRIFDLPDQPDTYVEVDMDAEWTISAETGFSKARWTPFAGRRVRGKVHRVVLRGRDAFLDGHVLAEPGFGKDARVDPCFDAVAVAVVGPPKRLSKVPGEPYLNGWGSSHGGELSEGEKAKPLVAPLPTKAPLRGLSAMDFAPSGAQIDAPLRTVSAHSLENPSLPHHIVSVDQFNKTLLGPILWTAERIKADIKSDKPLEPILQGKVMACMFYEVSTRTMNSFAAAMQRYVTDVSVPPLVWVKFGRTLC